MVTSPFVLALVWACCVLPAICFTYSMAASSPASIIIDWHSVLQCRYRPPQSNVIHDWVLLASHSPDVNMHGV